MLRFFFWRGRGRGVRQRAGITESLPSKWHHKIGSLLFCLQSEGMPEAVTPPLQMGEMNCVIYCKRAHSEIRSAYPIKGTTINQPLVNSLKHINQRRLMAFQSNRLIDLSGPGG